LEVDLLSGVKRRVCKPGQGDECIWESRRYFRGTFLLFPSLQLVKGRLLTDVYLARKNVYISAGSRKKFFERRTHKIQRSYFFSLFCHYTRNRINKTINYRKLKDFSPLLTKINKNLFKYSFLTRSKHYPSPLYEPRTYRCMNTQGLKRLIYLPFE
jgi:hypothetical protein